MQQLLRISQMLLGIICILLSVDVFGRLFLVATPAFSTPEPSYPIFLAGILAVCLSLCGAYCLAKGQIPRLIGFVIASFFCVAGLLVSFRFGAEALENFYKGGFGLLVGISMACTACTGLLFFGIFGYLLKRIASKTLSLAMVHISLVLLASGAYIDYYYEENAMVEIIVGAPHSVKDVRLIEDEASSDDALQELSTSRIPLGFSIRVKEFNITHYPNAPYTLYRMKNKAWEPYKKGLLAHRGRITYKGESWNIEDMQNIAEQNQNFLLIEGFPQRLLLQDTPSVKEYLALCELTDKKGMLIEELRVNDPIVRYGWQLSLVKHQSIAGQQILQIQARRAPGRILAKIGMVGLILSVTAWCWWRKKEDDEPQAPSSNEAQNIQDKQTDLQSPIVAAATSSSSSVDSTLSPFASEPIASSAPSSSPHPLS